MNLSNLFTTLCVASILASCALLQNESPQTANEEENLTDEPVQAFEPEIDVKDIKKTKKKRAINLTVKRYQQILYDLGYNTGRPDGISGKKTSMALTNFQSDYSLSVTGKLDAETTSILDRLSNQ